MNASHRGERGTPAAAQPCHAFNADRQPHHCAADIRAARCGARMPARIMRFLAL